MLSIIDSLREREKVINNSLSEKEKKLIFFKSVQNFLFYLSDIKDETERNEISQKIDFYFSQIEQKEFSFHISEKKEISKTIIRPLAFYFIRRFHFKYHGAIKVYLFIGIHIDLILLLTGVLKHIYYIPIACLILSSYWLYVEIFYAKKSKVY